MILSREIIIGEAEMIEGAKLVDGVEGFDFIHRPVALYEGKLLMSGGARFKSTAAAELVMNASDQIHPEGVKALGFHLDTAMTGLLRFPRADFDSSAVWREIMLLPEEVWQRLETLNV